MHGYFLLLCSIRVNKSVLKLAGLLAMLILVVPRLSAQTTKVTDGFTPPGLQAGAPEGSYSLSGFDNVNLYDGALNFSLPLMKIGGRGAAAHTILLPIERHWLIETMTDDQQNITVYPVDGREEQIKPGYGPGIMAIRYAGIGGQLSCEWHDPSIHYDIEKRYTRTLTRLSFTRPDGSEIEFRDASTGGASASAQPCGNHDPDSIGYIRGKVFYSVDGSEMTFISDVDVRDEVLLGSRPPEVYGPSGFMLLPDGTRYRLDGGKVSWIRDRNGNKITFVYGGSDGSQVTSITDSLNRQVTISYDVNEGGQYGVCDKISYQGFGGAPRVIRVSKTNLINVLRSGYSLTTYAYLFPNGNGANVNYNPTVVSSVWLPDSDGVTRRYQFQYNNYGELARVVLPTGGAYEYDYGAGTTNGTSDGLMFGFPVQQIYRRVIERRVYPDGGSGSTYATRMTYSVPDSQTSPCCSTTTVGYVTVAQRDASNNLLASSKHYFSGPGAANSFVTHSPVSVDSQMDGKENQTDVFDTNGTTVLRHSVTTWYPGPPIASIGNINPRIIETDTTIEPNGANLVAKQTFSYDQYNNQTDVYEYDYGSGAAGSLVRHTQTGYLTTNNGYDYACDPSSTCGPSANIANVIHIRSLPTYSSVFGATGPQQSRTSFEYDNYASDTQHAGLKDWYTVTGFPTSGLDSAYTTSLTTRGNLTSNTHYLLDSGGLETGSISSYAEYDITGNVVKAIDAKGNATTFDFSDRFGAPGTEAESNTTPTELSTAGQASYAMATKVTKPLGLISFTQFDYYVGRPVNGEDTNGVVSSGDSVNEPLDRPTKTIDGVNQSNVKSQGLINYDDTNRTVTSQSDLNSFNDSSLKSKMLYDGLGRTIEMRTYETDTNYIAMQTQYDAMGRAYRVSNPFRPLNNETPVWTTSAFDALGRVISITTPDNAVITTSYSGNTITVTDQAGKKRRSVTDALGRLVRVDEPDANGNLDSNGVPIQSTSYAYDVLGNLRSVTQGTQQRFFMYDSLSRLIRARNPEQQVNSTLGITDPITNNSQWCTSYSYDVNGNLVSKTDARGVVTTYAYDALNRNISVAYTNDPANTPTITRTYDSATNGKGRLYQTQNANATVTINAYDALGRPLSLTQQFGSVQFSVQRSYDLAGHAKSQTYPSGHVVNYSYDTAGRLNDSGGAAAFTGNLGDGFSRTYTSALEYDSSGRMTKEQLGTNPAALYNKLAYNSRGQLAEMRVGTSYTGAGDLTWNRGKIINDYSSQCSGASCNGSDNNGNLLKQTVSVANDDQNSSPTSWEQRYGYDSLNRLTSVAEYPNGGSQQNWQQSYQYDRWGNRLINGSTTWGNGINNVATTIDPNTNRLYAPNDPNHVLINYDSAGNQTIDSYTGNGQRTFDAENRMIAAQDNAGGWTYYSYDGDGRRVKVTESTATTANGFRWQVYGFDGEMVADYTMTPFNRAYLTNLTGEYGYRNGQLLIKATIGTTLTPNGGGGFETPAVGNGNYQNNPTGAGWTFSGSTGISGNGSALTSGNPNAPEGNQVAFLQGSSTSSITQSVDGLTPGVSYAVRFSAAQRANCCGNGGEGFQIFVTDSTLGSILLGTFHPSGTDYQDYSTITFSPTQEGHSHQLRFVGLNPSGADNTALIDNVRITIIDNVEWLVSDQLGTPRMIFDKTGSLAGTKRHDYLPFGEELFAGSGGRTIPQGYSASDGVRQQFTQKERDIETGLDYFGARYYASTQGRFTGVDVAGPDLRNPQTLNRYQYCLNNPLRHIDPNGLYEEDVHQDLTYALALAAGFNTNSAATIAAADQRTDDNPATTPMGMTPWGDDVEKRSLYHFTTIERRDDMWQTFKGSGSLQDLGTYEHAEQDSFSHAGFGPRLGHLMAGHAPDKTYNAPRKADQMAEVTFNTLKQALGILRSQGSERTSYEAVKWKTILPMVKAFNRARTAEEKRKIINQIVAEVQRQHEEQRRKREMLDLLRELRGRPPQNPKKSS